MPIRRSTRKPTPAADTPEELAIHSRRSMNTTPIGSRWGSRVLVIAVVAGLVGALFAGAAPAFTQPGLSVSPSKQVDERDYPPMPGTNPGAAAVIGTPSGCASPQANTSGRGALAAICDVIPLDIGAPAEKVDPKDSYIMEISMSWPNPTGANDVDLYLWNCAVPETYGTCTQIASSATLENNPEIILAGDLPGRRYFLTPQNFRGQNVGYHVKVTYTPTPFNFYIQPARARIRAPAGAAAIKAPPRGTSFPVTGEPIQGEAVESVKLEVPGPDGKPMTIDLPLFAGSQGREPEEGGLNFFVVGAAIVVSLIALLLALWWYKRKKEQPEAI